MHGIRGIRPIRVIRDHSCSLIIEHFDRKIRIAGQPILRYHQFHGRDTKLP